MDVYIATYETSRGTKRRVPITAASPVDAEQQAQQLHGRLLKVERAAEPNTDLFFQECCI